MAKRTFVGGATAIAEIWKGTITTTTTGHTYTLPIADENGNTVTFSYALVGGDSTVTLAAASWAAAWNASTDPRFTPMTATSNVGQVILTAETPGIPFYPGTPAGTGTWSGTGITQANAGESDFNTAANYAEEIVPVASDDVTFKSGQVIYGLQSAAILTGKVVADPGFKYAGVAGLPLKMVPTAFTWNASGTIASYVDTGTAAINVRIIGTANPTTGFGLYFTGGATTTSLRVESGSVGVAVNANEAATITTINLVAGICTVGAGATVTNFLQSDGTGELDVAATLASVGGGTFTTVGTGAVATLTVKGGSVIHNSTGTVTTLNINGGTCNLNANRASRTVTSTTWSGGTLIADSSVITFTNGIQISGSLQLTAKAA